VCVQRWGFLYAILRLRDLHHLPPDKPRGRVDRLIDVYVLVWTAVAAVVFAASFVECRVSSWANFAIATFLILLSLWRIIEVLSFHLNMLVSRVGRPGGVSTVASYERSFVLVLLNYLEVTLWFATWYSISVRQEVLSPDGPSPLLFSIFRESLAMMLVNTSGFFKPSSSLLLWAAMCFQSIVGLFLTIVVLARTLTMLPEPKEDKVPESG
jgi:hypothetical protein